MEKFSNEDSLRIITSMIEATKKDLRDNGFWFLFWGWLVFSACMIHFGLMKLGYAQPHLAWLLMVFGGIYTFVRGNKEEKEQKVRTYVDQFMSHVLVSFMFCMVIVLFNGAKLQLNTYPMIMMVYGTWLYISGRTLEFRPVVFGAYINWVLAVVSFYISFEFQLLTLAAAVLFGYIIPGYMLRSRFNKAEKSNMATA